MKNRPRDRGSSGHCTKVTRFGVSLLAACWLLAGAGFPVPVLGAVTPAVPAEFREAQESTFIIGLKVVDVDNKDLGNVTDMALDLEDARIVEVLVTGGGVLGFGERTVPVPPGAFLFDSASLALRLNIDKRKYKAAPQMDASRPGGRWQSARVERTYRYFGEAPYFSPDGPQGGLGYTEFEPLGRVQLSSEILKLPVTGLQMAQLGTVSAFQYNLVEGRVLHVIVQSVEFPHLRRVIPAQALRLNDAQDALYLDIKAAEFLTEPGFEWTNEVEGQYRQGTYSNDKIAADRGVNTRQNVTDGRASAYSPLAQGPAFDDVDCTGRIYGAMRMSSGLSNNAQGVEAGTLDGRVTLRGRVNTEAEKCVIEEIAASIVRPENVSNLLEVRPLAITDARSPR